MDTSKEYIKMCEKVEKIQQEWKPQAGDYCIGKNYDGYIQFGVGAMGLAKEYITWDNENGFTEDREDVVWFPRQDQLQEMVKDILTDTPFHNITEFYLRTHGEVKNYRYYCLHFMSMEQLWLAFAMKEKYNKTWNGEEWK